MGFAVILLFSIQTSQAKDCNVSVPANPQGHWSFRFVDGRKCWYEGENNYSKSLLQWPAHTPAQPPSYTEPVTASETGPDPAIKESDFENRWSGIRR